MRLNLLNLARHVRDYYSPSVSLSACNTPAGIVVNTLVFFTELGDLVLDPMAGGGVVGDVCKRFRRKCLMYDVNPIREDIVQHDLRHVALLLTPIKPQYIFGSRYLFNKVRNSYYNTINHEFLFYGRWHEMSPQPTML